MLTQKKFSIYEKFQKKEWKETIDKARKYDDLYHNIITPLTEQIDAVSSKISKRKLPVSTKKCKCGDKCGCGKKKNKTLVLAFADWHAGKITYGDSQKTFDDGMFTLKNNCRDFIESGSWDDIKILFLGDMVDGFGITDRGTKIESFPTDGKQIDLALSNMMDIEDIICSKFDAKDVSVYCVPGNHYAFGDYVVYRMSKLFLEKQYNVTDVHIAEDTRYLSFDVRDNLFMLEHGDDSKGMKSAVPNERNVNRTVINEMRKGVKKYNNVYYLHGHQHTLKIEECPQVEIWAVPSIVQNDAFADRSYLSARARQIAFSVNEQGIADTHYLYVD